MVAYHSREPELTNKQTFGVITAFTHTACLQCGTTHTDFDKIARYVGKRPQPWRENSSLINTIDA